MSKPIEEIYVNFQHAALPRYSQLGQDAILVEWVRKNVKRLLSDRQSPFVVDLGAFDGITLSNVYPFIAYDFHALLVEGSPKSFAMLAEKYTPEKFPEVTLAQIAIRTNGPRVVTWHDAPLVATTDNASFEKWKNTEKFRDHFIGTVSGLSFWSWFRQEWQVDPLILSVDLEGETENTVHAMASAGVRPYIAVVESNPSDPNSEKSMVDSFRRVDMRLAHKQEWDLFFVRDEDDWKGPSSEVKAICDKWYADAREAERKRKSDGG